MFLNENRFCFALLNSLMFMELIEIKGTVLTKDNVHVNPFKGLKEKSRNKKTEGKDLKV